MIPMYRPLNTARQEIRLLTVYPAHENATLECSLQTVSLLPGERTEYETMSYVWGNALDKRSLYLDGREIEIPKQAVAALQAARRPDQTRLVWMDSVCINQTDIREREQQVTMMTEIYLSSIGNIIFLGADENGIAGRAFSAISGILARAPRSDGNSLSLDIEALTWLFSFEWFR